MDGWVKTEVIELDPPRRMVWAWWLDGATPTTVTFELASEREGTRLRLTHASYAPRRIPSLTTREGTVLCGERLSRCES